MIPDRVACGLCEAGGPLLKSHMIPRFVSRWVQETSATGMLLSPSRGGKPLQDVPTVRMFCSSCEQVLSRDEKTFAEKVFRPSRALSESWSGFTYEAWLSRFHAGLMLKAALVRAPDWVVRIAERSVIPALRAYLLGENRWPRPYEMHLVFTDYLPLEQLPADVAPTIQWYLMRGADLTSAFNESRSCYLYASIPGFQFWMPIRPARDRGWHGTKVRGRGEFRRPSSQHVGVVNWLDFLSFRANGASSMTAGTKEQQESRRRRLLRDEERTLNSESLRAFFNSPPRE